MSAEEKKQETPSGPDAGDKPQDKKPSPKEDLEKTIILDPNK